MKKEYIELSQMIYEFLDNQTKKWRNIVYVESYLYTSYW